jgi:hypothetical protein
LLKGGDFVILYNDETTFKHESEEKYVECIDYLYEKWKANKENVTIFIRLSVSTWYALALDGPILTLDKIMYSKLTHILAEVYHFFHSHYANCENCQWLFGYMMEVRTDLFLSTELEYNEIEQVGINLIEQASKNGNVFAKVLSRSSNVLTKEQIEEYVRDSFDSTYEIDRYFIEILSSHLKEYSSASEQRSDSMKFKIRKIIRFVLLMLNILSFGLVVLVGVMGIAYEMLEPASYEKLLEWFKISWDFEQIWTFSILCLVIFLVTYTVRRKFFR